MTQRNLYVQKGYILTYHSILSSASYNKQNYPNASSFSCRNCVHGTIMTASCIYPYIWEQNEHTQKNFRKLPITSPSLISISTCGHYILGESELKFEILSLLLEAQVHLYKSISPVSGHQHSKQSGKYQTLAQSRLEQHVMHFSSTNITTNSAPSS